MGEEQLTDSLSEHMRALLRDAFEGAPFEFWVRDLDGRCIIANAATRALGCIEGSLVEEAQVPPEVIAFWQANNRRAYAGEFVQQDFEDGKGDEQRTLQCHIVPLRINGAIRGVLGFNIDVSADRRAERALRESERRLAEAMQVGRMGWLDWDLAANSIKWSPETFRLFGHEPGGSYVPTVEGTVGMVPPEDAERVRAHMDAALAGTAPFDFIHRMVRADGKIVDIHALGEVRRDSNGIAERVLGTVVDITERKRAEDELREVDRQRSEFLGHLSHELRNPLAVIRSSVHCIDQAAVVDEQVRRAIEVIERQTRHLAHMVDDLLDVTRIRSGKINLQRSPVDLADLVRSTVADHGELLAGRKVTVSTPESPPWTHGDPTRLAQILGNLLSNAAKFTPTGGTIAVSLAVAGSQVVLEVSDTGVGIDAESLEGLFVPFVQADRSLDRSRQGLGLGLALVKRLVELHGGEARAHSAGPGLGACISITLPLIECESLAPRPAPIVAVTPRNVLIIEDDQDVAEWLAHALSFSGHRVTITCNGDAGIAKARELVPDVVLCDLGLPGGLDGFAVARMLQRDASLATIYRVALSGYTQPEDQAKAREAGFEAHLSKPPDMNALAHLLAELPRLR